MQHDFSDRFILVTGAGRGLGSHLATQLAGFGVTVGVADIDAENCGDVVAAIEQSGGRAFSEAVSGVLQELLSHHGRQDGYRKLDQIGKPQLDGLAQRLAHPLGTPPIAGAVPGDQIENPAAARLNEVVFGGVTEDCIPKPECIEVFGVEVVHGLGVDVGHRAASHEIVDLALEIHATSPFLMRAWVRATIQSIVERTSSGAQPWAR